MAQPDSSSSTKIPDLYRLLNLEPLESDTACIQAAVKRLVVKAQKSRDKQTQQRAARIVELARHHLLSPEHKLAYDRLWRKNCSEMLVGAVHTAASTWDQSLLEPLLPAGDPAKPFDLSGYLESVNELPELNLQSDYERLRCLLTGEVPPPEPQTILTQPLSVTGTGGDNSFAETSGNSRRVQSSVPTSRPKAPAQKSLASKLRRKRDKSMLLMIGGMLVSTGTVLGLLFYFVNRPRQPQQPQVVVLNPDRGGKEIQKVQPSLPPVRASGLPKVSGLEQPATANEVTLPPSSPANDGQMPAPATQLPMVDVDTTSANAAAKESNAAMVAPASAPPSTPEAGASEGTAMPPPEPVLSDDEKSTWQASMLAIRQQLGQQQYADAQKALEQLGSTVKTSAQRQQFSRLATIAELSEAFHESMLAAILGLEAGEAFKLNTTDVSFVEGSEEILVIRMRGENQRFEITDLPNGLAYALANLQLDTEHPTTLAKKAAFTIVHPKSSKQVLESAREWINQAAQAGVVPDDLVAVFEDDYQL